MANTAVTSVQCTPNAQAEFVAKLATVDDITTAEIFDITPAKGDGKFVIIISNASAVNGSVTYSLAAGDFWAAGTPLTGTIAQGKSYAVEVETAKYKKKGGALALTVTPATGKKLKTDHALTVACIQLR